MQKKNGRSRIVNILFICIVIILLYIIYGIYKENYFNDFVRAEYNLNVSEFKRDKNVKYGKYDSYRITSPEFNDAIFYKTVKVTPNTPYKVSCMIKTENVETQKENSIAGAGISIENTTECSVTIKGTTKDWQKVELLFNSKARTEVNIGFRLGAYNDNCKGTAWFSDLKLEVGSKTQDSHWKMACFVVENLDINIEMNSKKQHVVTSINNKDLINIQENMDRLKSSLKILSNYQMTMDYDIIEIKEPVNSITYDKDNGYYLSNADVADKIRPYIEQNNYDYIFVVVRFGENMHSDKQTDGDWIGLRGYGLLRYWIFKYSSPK